MAELNSLIRVRKHVIDQKQKFLAELYRQAEELKNQQDNLETQLAIETEKTRDMGIEMIQFFGPYAKTVKLRVQDIERARETLEKRIKAAQDDMRDAFAEMKKIEIIRDRRLEENAEELKQKESDILDEIALESFRREGGE